jgi:hypothetical protein
MGSEAASYPSLNKNLSDKDNSKKEYPLVEGDIPMVTSIKSFTGMPPPPPPPGPPPKRASASSKAKRNVSTKNMHNDSDVSPGEEIPQLMHQTKKSDTNKVIPNGIVHNSPLTLPLPLSEGFPGQFMHRKNQWDMNRDISSGRVTDAVCISPRLGAQAFQNEENEHFLVSGIEVRSMSPERVPVRSISPKFDPPIIQKEDHCNHEREVCVEDPPQTRCQKKQSDITRVIPPGAVELSPFGHMEFFRDFKEWPSSPHGSSPKKTWTRGLSPRELNEDAGAKRTGSEPQQMDKEKDNKRLATATAEAPPSGGKCSPPASATHEALKAEKFFQHKLSASPQSKQLETSSNIPKGKVSANMSSGSHESESSTDFEPRPVVGPTSTPCQATAERSMTEKSERDDDFLGTMPSNEGDKQWETRKEDIPTGKVLANMFGGLHTMQSSTEIKSRAVASSFSSTRAATECSNAETSTIDDGSFGTTSSNEEIDTWILPVRPSNQLVSIDETKWGASAINSPESSEMESGNDWFQSTSFESETKGTDGESKFNANASMDTMSKSQAHGVTALVSKPFSSSNVTPTQDLSSAGKAELANSRTRDLASLTPIPYNETSNLVGAEEENTTKRKKRRGFFNFFSGVSSFWT